jgi:hypothetical protein
LAAALRLNQFDDREAPVRIGRLCRVDASTAWIVDAGL